MANIQRMTPKRLGEIFLHSGLVTQEQLEECLRDQQASGRHLGEILVERGFVTERDVAEAIATQFSLPYLSPTQYYVPGEIRRLISRDTMQKHQIVPIDMMGKILMVVIAGPVDNALLDDIERQTDTTLQVYVGTISDVRGAIEKYSEEPKAGDAPRG